MRISQTLVTAFATTALAAAPPKTVEGLTPIQPWNVHYEPNSCTAQREYGDGANPIFLGFVPSSAGNNYELLIATNGPGPNYAEELDGSIDFGSGPIKAWLLHFGTSKPRPVNFYKFRISTAEMAQAKTAQSVTFHMHGRGDFVFTLAFVPEVLAKLDQCTNDLRHFWNMTDSEQKNIAAPAVGDVRSVFSSSDYPDEALTREQQGKAQFLLLIDETGKVAGCDVVSPSGIPALDGMGCQVIRERAKFKPALDQQGKPIRSSTVTPPIVWLTY
jgi:TonB family protein